MLARWCRPRLWSGKWGNLSCCPCVLCPTVNPESGVGSVDPPWKAPPACCALLVRACCRLWGLDCGYVCWYCVWLVVVVMSIMMYDLRARGMFFDCLAALSDTYCSTPSVVEPTVCNMGGACTRENCTGNAPYCPAGTVLEERCPEGHYCEVCSCVWAWFFTGCERAPGSRV